jgi:hypothetical protein
MFSTSTNLRLVWKSEHIMELQIHARKPAVRHDAVTNPWSLGRPTMLNAPSAENKPCPAWLMQLTAAWCRRKEDHEPECRPRPSSWPFNSQALFSFSNERDNQVSQAPNISLMVLQPQLGAESGTWTALCVQLHHCNHRLHKKRHELQRQVYAQNSIQRVSGVNEKGWKLPIMRDQVLQAN